MVSDKGYDEKVNEAVRDWKRAAGSAKTVDDGLNAQQKKEGAFNPSAFALNQELKRLIYDHYFTPSRFIPMSDQVNHPPHYTQHPSGVECIEITEHMNFNLGNATKYIWRSGLKKKNNAGTVQDLKKAIWYLNREIDRIALLTVKETKERPNS